EDDTESTDIIVKYPTLIPNLENIVAVSVGVDHSLCLSGYGHFYIFGSNTHKQLGINKYHIGIPTRVPGLKDISYIYAAEFSSFCSDKYGKLYAWGDNTDCMLGLGIMNSSVPKPKINRRLKNIIQVASGNNHSIFLDAHGNVYSVGNNEY